MISMVEKYKIPFLIAAVFFLVGFGTAKVISPTKVEYKEKEVVKYVEKKTESKNDTSEKVKNKDKVVIITETTYPDGRKVKETKIVDKGTELSKSASTSKTQTETQLESTKEQEKTVTYSQPNWRLSALAALDGAKMQYGGILERRIIGPVYVGGFGYQSGLFGVSVGLSF